MPRKPLLPDQFTTPLRLACPNPQCRHEFFKEQAWLKKNHEIWCPSCGGLVVAGEDEINRLLGLQVKNIADKINQLRKDSTDKLK